MLALTLWQPWASLVAAGHKPWEFRGWAPPRRVVGQRIAIHAAARLVRPGEVRDLVQRLSVSYCAWTTALLPAALPLLENWRADPARLPLSSVLCTAVLGEPRRANEIAAELGAPAAFDKGDGGNWNWGWPLADVQPLAPPVPARGRLGLWEWRA